jgi:hypothetical protein
MPATNNVMVLLENLGKVDGEAGRGSCSATFEPVPRPCAFALSHCGGGCVRRTSICGVRAVGNTDRLMLLSRGVGGGGG